jgi:hypothetical protein
LITETMRVLKLFSLLFILLLFAGLTDFAKAQSKTEEAKERLKGKRSGSGSDLISMLSFTFEFMPQFFYFVPVYQDEPYLSYSPAPYSVRSGGETGIRNFQETGQFGMLETSFSMNLPQTSKSEEVRNVDFRWHLRYWALRGGYNYLKEHRAPYGIHQFNAAAERKFRFLPRSDGGFFLGYREYHLSGDTFRGFDIGFDISAYVFNPVSIQYIFNTSIMKHGETYQHQFLVHAHKDRFRISMGYRHLDILGVGFNAFTAGVGFNL